MISVDEANKIISENIPKAAVEEILLEKAFGKVLKENCVTDRPQPPFNKSLMDGIAISFNDYKKGLRTFNIIATQSAGINSVIIKGEGNCSEIMTGAMLSSGTDTVIPIEDIEVNNELAEIKENAPVSRHQFIQKEGSDLPTNTVILNEGQRLYAPQIAIAASIGKNTVKVSKFLTVAVVETGDELINIDQRPEPYQIRRSNSYFICTAINQTHLMSAKSFHFKDDKKELKKQLGALLETFDVLVLSGGVSKGKFDYVPQVLEELSVKKCFHRVSQKPGKPFWFGISSRNKPVFALPGNPISTQVCTYRYVIPQLLKSLGAETKNEYAQLNVAIKKPKDLTFFLPVKIVQSDDGCLIAEAIFTSHSGHLMSMAASEGFMEIAGSSADIPAGFSGPIYRWI